jgi:hypothetical protein
MCRGEQQRFEFIVVDPAAAPDSFGGDDPSQIIGAGEFVGLCEGIARHVPANPQKLPYDRHKAAVGGLNLAQNALGEVLKFIPPGEDEVPDSAFITDEGRALRDKEPGRFRRGRLAAVQGALVELMGKYAAADPRLEEVLGADAMAAIEVLPDIREKAKAVLDRLRGPAVDEVVESLRPRPGDYARVFDAAVVDHVRAHYEAMWAAPPPLRIPRARTQMRASASIAAMLNSGDFARRQFPGGYRQVVSFLQPFRVWIVWKFVEPGKTSGTSFDGLVWVDDHFAWFPRPWKALSGLTDRVVH